MTGAFAIKKKMLRVPQNGKWSETKMTFVMSSVNGPADSENTSEDFKPWNNILDVAEVRNFGFITRARPQDVMTSGVERNATEKVTTIRSKYLREKMSVERRSSRSFFGGRRGNIHEL